MATILATWIFSVGLITSVLTQQHVGYFWHVTDFHYDHTYNTSRLSCNPDLTPPTIGRYGTYWCDSPWALINSSIQAMADIHPHVDFLLWTGDTILHASDDHLDYSINAAILNKTTNALKHAFPGTSVYATFGNHDYYPNNQFPPYNNVLYNDTLSRWGTWINDISQTNSFLKGGYYTVKTQFGLRIIGLNTNLYYTSNKASVNESDPADQLTWLQQTLTNARVAKEKVLLTAHIPPGVHTPNAVLWMYESYNDELVNILRRNTDLIVGMHFGHDHADGFKVLPDMNNNPGAPIFIAPSVTPWKYIPTAPEHNPGIRLVKYDRQTGKHLEIQQYYLDITEANKNGFSSWVLEYNTTDAYGISMLTATSLHDLINKLGDKNSDEFTRYWRHFTVSPPNLPPCDDACHSTIVCGFTNFQQNSLDTCKQNLVSGTISLVPFIYVYIISLIIGT